MIVYFTGTGNSRFTADMLADKLNDEAVSANSFIKAGKSAELSSDKPWVFVCPVYVSAPPRIFTEFIRNGKFTGSRQVWFIVTSAGTSPCACPVYCSELAEEKGMVYMGTANVHMPQNYLVFFKTKEKAECDAIVEESKSRITELAELIGSGTPFPDPHTTKFDYITTEMIIGPYYKWFMGTKKFAVGDQCIGCGKCASVCPLNNIRLVDKKPAWGDKCTHCVACINLCPTHAIEYGKASIGKPRYKCVEYKK